MKILLALDDFQLASPTSASELAYSMAKEFLGMGHKVHIISSTQDKNKEGKSNHEGIEISRIYSEYHPRWRAYLSLYNPFVISSFKKIIKEIKPDIVHFHHIHQYISYGALKVAKRQARATFLTAHDVMLVNFGKFFPKGEKDVCKISTWEQIKGAGKRHNPFRNLITRHYLKNLKKIFAVSDSLKELLNINGIKNVTTIYNGLDVDDWKLDSKELEKFKNKHNLLNKKIIFFGGRLSGAKGGAQVLKTISLLKKEIDNLVLLVAGEKNQYVSEMKGEAKRLAVENNIIFLGWLPKKEMSLAYHSADVCLSPSLCFETFGMTNLEAMACGKPVIASYFGGPKEVIEDGETGYLINPNDEEIIFQKTKELLKNPQKAKQFGESGYQRVKSQFSLTRQIDQTLKWYQKFNRSDD